MIIELVRYFMSLGVMGFLWYILNSIIIDFIDTMVAKYPTLYPVATVTFVKSMSHWFIFLFIVGLSYSLFVVAQRTKPEGRY